MYQVVSLSLCLSLFLIYLYCSVTVLIVVIFVTVSLEITNFNDILMYIMYMIHNVCFIDFVYLCLSMSICLSVSIRINLHDWHEFSFHCLSISSLKQSLSFYLFALCLSVVSLALYMWMHQFIRHLCIILCVSPNLQPQAIDSELSTEVQKCLKSSILFHVSFFSYILCFFPSNISQPNQINAMLQVPISKTSTQAPGLNQSELEWREKAERNGLCDLNPPLVI